jgi:hypothetical protein
MASFVADRYVAVISELERALLHDQGQLDTATARILREKLLIIDQAIAEARAALMSDPYNGYLTDHYTRMMRGKLTTLWNAASVGSIGS